MKKDFLYNSSPNWEVEIVDENAKTCYIFFSSNGLYSDDSEEEFEEVMIQGNRYEWKSIANAVKKRRGVKKIIYVRDLYKKFYIKGINPECNSIDALVDLLWHETENDEVITVGISSGAYMAVVVGCQIKARKVFCISGQFDLQNHLTEEELKEFSVSNGSYVNIVQMVASNDDVPIYYFCPINCWHDRANYELVKDIKNVRCFVFPDKIHAATVYPYNFPDILCLSNERLDELTLRYRGKFINKKLFLLHTMTFMGMWEFVKRVYKSKFSISGLKKLWDVKE